MDRDARDRRSANCWRWSGIDPARLRGFPHELSGGMRQRVGIAMALALQPEIVVMDEPTTALDVVVQREILLEVARLRRDLGFSVIFITHDLPMLVDLSDRIAVMYAGEIVERAPRHWWAAAPPTPIPTACRQPARTSLVSGGNCAGSPAHHPTCARRSSVAASPPAARTRSSPAPSRGRSCCPSGLPQARQRRTPPAATMARPAGLVCRAGRARETGRWRAISTTAPAAPVGPPASWLAPLVAQATGPMWATRRARVRWRGWRNHERARGA